MNPVLTVARKELRALFQSPVALLFLGVFQLVTLFTFFSASRFFARNLADVRPLFEWLPLLLVFLVAAVTMRAWAEERKLGTLEVLMTLPVTTRDLVLGKFLAAMGLVATALALTVPLPLMVSVLGPLDWGPVIGGYVGALLLGGLYVSLGLAISARTDNQIVALMLTLVVGGLMWVVGTDAVTALFDNATAEGLRAIGTGARFESLERGVLDLRDLVYYGALTVFFLALNHAFLDTDRYDAGSENGRARSTAAWTLVALTGANAVAAVVWLTPVTAARADLTAHGEYSISDTTEDILAQLDEPLFIDGYFSERTHPKLAPLVPQIRDTLEEYAIAGGGQVEVSFADPNDDETLEQEIAEQYSIRSVPFQVDDRHQQAVVNSFFHVLIRYGDQYEVLSFDDLIEVYADSSAFEVKLRNLEYDLTRTIKKVSQDFSSFASVVADLPEPATLTLYVTPGTLPEDYAETLPVVREVATALAEEGGAQLTFVETDPSDDAALQERLFADYGLRPLAVDLFGTQTFYFELVLTMGDEVERLAPRGEVTQADLETAIEAALQRVTPGQLTTVGLLTEEPEAPPPNPQLPPQFQPPPPQPDYRLLERVLGEDYEITRLDLADGPVPDTVDVLVVAKEGPLTDAQQFAVDQYLMRGGRILAFAGPRTIEVGRDGLSSSEAAGGLRPLLETWGASIADRFVLDEQNALFPRPVQRRVGGMTLQSVELTPYPFFVDVRTSGFERGHPALAGLNGVTFPWASPVTLDPPEGVEGTVLARSTGAAWTASTGSLEATGPLGETGEQTLAVVLEGTFPSHFADKPNPHFGGGAGDGDATGRTVKSSLPDARVAVVAAPEMVSDLILNLAGQPGGEVHRGNLQFLQNLIDWSVEDTALLEIRSAGAFARTLDPLSEEEAALFEAVQYVLALVLLAGIAVGPRSRRRAVQPLAVPQLQETA